MEESLRNTRLRYTSLWMFTQLQHSSFKFNNLIFFIKNKNFNCKPNRVFIPHKIWQMSTTVKGKSITKFEGQNYFQHNSFSNMTNSHLFTEQRIKNWNILIHPKEQIHYSEHGESLKSRILIQTINCKVILPVYKRHFTFKTEQSFPIFWRVIWLNL
jgi:hypothetical protein